MSHMEKLQVKQLTRLHLRCWESSGREERPGTLLLYALKIPSEEHKMEIGSFKEISETASSVQPSKQPSKQSLGAHAEELWWCSEEKCGLHNCPLQSRCDIPEHRKSHTRENLNQQQDARLLEIRCVYCLCLCKSRW